MTDHELFLLAAGISIGSNLTVLVWIVIDYVSGRRADRRRTGECEVGLPRKTDLQPETAAEPHPAELLEASVRNFELKLWDGLARVEDAARRDGLL